MVCAFANGNVLPPFHVYPGQRINSQWTQDSVPETYFSVTDKGWMETDVFYGWIANRFLKQIPPLRPIVLLLDGHESHIDIHVSKICAENGVLLFCLPPHCSHVLQPLDVGFFSSLKAHWKKSCKTFAVNNPGVTVNKMNFARVFKDCWNSTVAYGKVVNAFEKSGIWPLNPSKIPKEQFGPSKVYCGGVECTDQSLNQSMTPKPQEPSVIVMDKENVTPNTSLASLQSILTASQLALFRRRLAGGFDLDASHDPLYAAWKSLVLDETPKASTSSDKGEPPLNAARKQLTFVPAHLPSSQASQTSPAFSEILIYPGAPKKRERKRSLKHSLPRHLTSAEAIKLMEEEEERKKNLQVEKQKRQEEREKKREEKEKMLKRKKEERIERQKSKRSK